MPYSWLTHLTCTKCGKRYEKSLTNNICTIPECHGALYACYEFGKIINSNCSDTTKKKKYLLHHNINKRETSIWRWHELMPAPVKDSVVSLGEGGTPCVKADRLARYLNLKNLWIKDESGNPTGSFKARGLAAAVTMAKVYGVKHIALPTAGNAGGAAAAYAARAGIECSIFMPSDTPPVFKKECEAFGAHVTLVDGLIDDCGKIVASRKKEMDWFDMSTLKEPYRVEGKKTLGYELAESFKFSLPDVIVYPTGGGTGLIGMWKAFDEMEKLGWIESKRPRMISVQAEGCASIVRAFEAGSAISTRFENAHTIASGLRVPKAFADYLILDIIKKSNGLAISVSDSEMEQGVADLSRFEGIFAAPEGGAALSAVKKLIDAKHINRDDTIVVFNTGSAYKYL
jgi:threonine synthase